MFKTNLSGQNTISGVAKIFGEHCSRMPPVTTGQTYWRRKTRNRTLHGPCTARFKSKFRSWLWSVSPLRCTQTFPRWGRVLTTSSISWWIPASLRVPPSAAWAIVISASECTSGPCRRNTLLGLTCTAWTKIRQDDTQMHQLLLGN